MPTESTSPPRIIQVSRSPAPDGQSRVEDEAAVGSVLEGAANNTDDLATPRAVVVALQSSISAGESEPPSASDRVEYKPANEGFRRNAIAEDTVSYGTSGFISSAHLAFEPALDFMLRGVVL